jgi:hypothetical protein
MFADGNANSIFSTIFHLDTSLRFIFCLYSFFLNSLYWFMLSCFPSFVPVGSFCSYSYSLFSFILLIYFLCSFLPFIPLLLHIYPLHAFFALSLTTSVTDLSLFHSIVHFSSCDCILPSFSPRQRFNVSPSFLFLPFILCFLFLFSYRTILNSWNIYWEVPGLSFKWSTKVSHGFF